ncbi:glycerophosphoryl diester esterase [Legionella spiritensis]|uniref:Glycerophosphoryl diester esterase n=2 Tax=Legionella spiritensis TaxID=452 RepID=A0A0W0YYV8_LEGSP|nr:glycerophosphoryl diester esterase [Legionella spiritensis]SNV34465.1 glycerophosphoryl diester phosphodiesterase [Legionella spiritensis]
MLPPMQVSNKVIAHRGASAYAPENTLAAFNKALAMGCRCVEFDVILSADGEPFVFHDESLKRTTNGQGRIGEVTAEYLQSLDAGSWFSKSWRDEKIPHFRDVLKWLVFTECHANIEIKPYPGKSEETTVTVLSYLHRHWPAATSLPLVSSFDWSVLTLCRTLAPEMPLGLLLDEWDDHWAGKAGELQCYSIHLNRRILNAKRVQTIKEQGYQVFAYTVNRKRQAMKLLEWGVDAVFSDYPDLLS